MVRSREETTETLPREALDSLLGTALFYPCSGDDLEIPITLFAPTVSDFYFVDVRRPTRPRLLDFAQVKTRQRGDPDVFVDTASGNEFRVHRYQHRAEDFLDKLPDVGVFFFRGDNPVEGEGSSGILWLGGHLFSRVLSKLVPGGLVVTDGSNPGPDGPIRLSDFYHNREVRRAALPLASPFEYGGRGFTCIGYVGEKNGPTLIWRAE